MTEWLTDVFVYLSLSERSLKSFDMEKFCLLSCRVRGEFKNSESSLKSTRRERKLGVNERE